MRPFLAGRANLLEIENHWTIDQLTDVHEAMDIEQEMRDHIDKKGSK